MKNFGIFLMIMGLMVSSYSSFAEGNMQAGVMGIMGAISTLTVFVVSR